MRAGAAATWIDTTLDVRSDAGGRDPDQASPTLRRYHQLLWSKPLPNGDAFDLDTTSRGYLHHQSHRGEFWLASDAVVQTFLRWRRTAALTTQLTASEKRSFMDLGYTIGGMMVFPSQKVGSGLTINGARGFTSAIADRMDLTLECIRRLYRGESSPLDATLNRYSEFFALFETFQGYVDFFLLQDLVNEVLEVDFFIPFDDFRSPAVPLDLDSFRLFRRSSMAFVIARNRRIDSIWGSARTTPDPSRDSRSRRRPPDRLVMGRLRRRL